MATKWKGWTAHPAVKILSFLFIIALFLVVPNVIIAAVFGILAPNHALLLLAIAAALAPVPLILLFLGTGRTRRSESDEVQLHGLDKLYLDLGLCLVIPWIIFVIHLLDDITRFYEIDRFTLQVVFSVGVLFAAIPSLLWLMSFVKRIKAGRFWRHTLVFVILHRSTQFIRRVVSGLWAGASLTKRVALISAAAFFAMFLIGAFSAAARHAGPSFILALAATAAVAYLLLRYARRVHVLRKYAEAVSAGSYGTKVDVGRGELGSIADSIGSISDGIHTAVEERMKSERLKTELITNVSHDIRTPLTSIITYVDLLKQEGLICEKAPEYL